MIAVGIIGICILLILFFLGMPLAFAMALVGFFGFAFLSSLGAAFTIIGQDIFEQFSSYSLSVIPMFILMGSFAFASGIGQKLYEAAYIWLGHLRGGLTMATILACSGFASVSGSSVATAATIGQISLSEMKKYHYDDALATGSVAAAGSIGILIPPSAPLIIYGFLAQQSISELFAAGILPGILLTLLFLITNYVICLRNPTLGPPGPSTTLRRKTKALSGVIEAIILFCIVIGGLIVGWFTPNQAGAIGAAAVLLLGLAKRSIRLEVFWQSCKAGLRTSCMVLFLITGAIIFGHFLALSKIPFILASIIGGLPLPPVIIIAFILLIWFIGGWFMDSMSLLVLLLPIFLPMLNDLGIDLVWFGILLILVGEAGVITPPVGVNVFTIKGIAPDVSLVTIFKGIFPFLGAIILCMIIVIIFPIIVRIMPNLLK